jgi:hypothetical protein
MKLIMSEPLSLCASGVALKLIASVQVCAPASIAWSVCAPCGLDGAAASPIEERRLAVGAHRRVTSAPVAVVAIAQHDDRQLAQILDVPRIVGERVHAHHGRRFFGQPPGDPPLAVVHRRFVPIETALGRGRGHPDLVELGNVLCGDLTFRRDAHER